MRIIESEGRAGHTSLRFSITERRTEYTNRLLFSDDRYDALSSAYNLRHFILHTSQV